MSSMLVDVNVRYEREWRSLKPTHARAAILAVQKIESRLGDGTAQLKLSHTIGSTEQAIDEPVPAKEISRSLCPLHDYVYITGCLSVILHLDVNLVTQIPW